MLQLPHRRFTLTWESNFQSVQPNHSRFSLLDTGYELTSIAYFVRFIENDPSVMWYKGEIGFFDFVSKAGGGDSDASSGENDFIGEQFDSILLESFSKSPSLLSLN